MAKLTGKGLTDHCISKLGTPYVYGAKGSYGKLTTRHLNDLISAYPSVFTNIYITKAKRFVGQVCTDCSGLIGWYTGKIIGSYQMYSSAYTRLPISEIDKFASGVVLWKPGHVAVYLGDGKYAEIEAKGINYGTVKDDARKRGFEYGLTFKEIDYTYCKKVEGTWKGINPYKEPTTTVYYDKANRKVVCTGDGAKWVQWELREAGFDIVIDGRFGPASDKALREFQQSCKIKVDGRCGSGTRKQLKIN